MELVRMMARMMVRVAGAGHQSSPGPALPMANEHQRALSCPPGSCPVWQAANMPGVDGATSLPPGEAGRGPEGPNGGGGGSLRLLSPRFRLSKPPWPLEPSAWSLLT